MTVPTAAVVPTATGTTTRTTGPTATVTTTRLVDEEQVASYCGRVR
jgi:hypothetical protein